MKKYLWLLGATAAVVAVVLSVSGAVKNSRPVVETVTLEPQTVEQTVLCTGKVEEAKGNTQAVAAAGKKVQIRVAVPEGRLRQVAVGQRVTVTGTAFGADSYSGTVASLGNTAYSTVSGGTVVDAVIALDAADSSLRCGLTAKAGICVDRVEDGLLIPYDCLLSEDGEEFVYLLQNGCAVRRVVQTGAELADGVLVTAGLEAGDRLIRDAGEISADGMRVRVE